MNLQSITLVFFGAGAGGVTRYLFSAALNPLVRTLPLGTLVVNLCGSYLAGALIVTLAQRADLETPLKLLLVVGFMGGFTTFSAFALEVSGMLESQRWGAAALTIGLHVSGSILAALAGLATARALAG